MTGLPKIAIVGAGAIGSGVGAVLHQAGQDVTLIGRPDHVAAIKRRGLLMQEGEREVALAVRAAERLDFRPDLLLFATKVQDVEEACKQSLPHAQDVPAVMLQNGVSGDAIAASVLGPANVIGCVIRFGIVYLEPGRIVRHSRGKLTIGEAFQPNGPRVHRIAQVLNQGIETTITDNLVGARWTKLVVNVQAAIQAATGLDMGECGRYPELNHLALGLAREAALVAAKGGTRLAPLDNVTDDVLKALQELPPPPYAQGVLAGFGSIVVFARGLSPMSSTLQSRKRGKKTEVDYLNGDVVREGAASGVATPLNEAIVRLLHGLEATDTYVAPVELWEKVATGPRPSPDGAPRLGPPVPRPE